MNLRIKFNLALGLASLIGIGVSSYITNELLQENARLEVQNSARIMMESAIAVRNYTIKEVRPLLNRVQHERFISQTVPAYAASQYIKSVQKKNPDYNYREATLNPTNPENRATSWEADLIYWFRGHENKELVGERESPTGKTLYLSRPIKITNPKCLSCHDKPSNAPPTLIETYGNANGFGWKLNDVIGIQVVTVPMSLPLQRASELFYYFLGLTIAVFLLVAILLNIMLHFIVIKPILTISKQADKVSKGDLEIEELLISGKDEIASAGQSFNRMHRSLINALGMLDETETENDL